LLLLGLMMGCRLAAALLVGVLPRLVLEPGR
jgi:hypothetical protein